MRLPEFARTSTFRSALVIFGAYLACTLVIFGTILWETSAYLTSNVDRLIGEVAKIIASADSDRWTQRLGDHLQSDPRRVKLGGLFDGSGRRLAGNIASVPAGLRADGTAETVSVERTDGSRRQMQTARAVAERLPNGDTLVIGREPDEVTEIFEIVESVAAVGLLAALGIGVAAAAWLSLRSQRRLEEVNRRIQRIIAGELRQRLPTEGNDDPFDRLALLVNGMLDDIETLVKNLASAGDDIAHDLRTPLTRVRIGLERARANARSLAELQEAADQAIGGIDHAISIVTALLRIREIEQTRRVVGFERVKVAELLREVGDLYEPIAEEKRLALTVKAESELTVRADRDLLFEAIANLIDNAVKYTPEGGRIELSLAGDGGNAVVRVSDSGPGVSEAERELIVQRFYRSDRSRHTKGLGLGLSLVSAIVKLHGFRLNILPGPGFVAEIAVQPTDP